MDPFFLPWRPCWEGLNSQGAPLMQPKGLDCETEEDVGLVAPIGFHQMGGP